MELIVISSPVCFNGEMKLVNQLFEAGLQIFHLRKEGLSLEKYKQLITGIDGIYHDRIALHQFHEIADDFGIKRLHYPEKMRKDKSERKLQDNNDRCIFSTSVHQLKDLNNLKHFSYAFFGPVFNSLSKPGYRGVIDHDFIFQGSPIKTIALGGIEEKNIDTVKAMKFDGAALLGALWDNPSRSIHTYKRILGKCQTTDHM